MNENSDFFLWFVMIAPLFAALGATIYIWKKHYAKREINIPDYLPSHLKTTIQTQWQNLPKWCGSMNVQFEDSHSIQIREQATTLILTRGFIEQLTPQESEFLIASHFQANVQFGRLYSFPLIALICSPILSIIAFMDYSQFAPILSLIVFSLISVSVPKIRQNLLLQTDQTLAASHSSAIVATTALQKLAGSNPQEKSMSNRLDAMLAKTARQVSSR